MNWLEILGALDEKTIEKLMGPVDRFLDDVSAISKSLETIAECLPSLVSPVVVDMSKVSEEEARNIKPGSIIREYPKPTVDCEHFWQDTYGDGITQNLQCAGCGMEVSVPLKMIQRSFAVFAAETTNGT